MFERFTEKALRVILLAQEEARRSGHNFVGTEQIVLGLIGEGSGIGSKALRNAGVKLIDARREVERLIGKGTGFVAVEIPFTPRAKNILEQSLQQARAFNHSYIGTEHMLLALLEDTEGVAVQLLTNLEVDINKVRRVLLAEVGQIVDAAGLAMKKKEEELEKKIKERMDREKKEIDAERKEAMIRRERINAFRERLEELGFKPDSPVYNYDTMWRRKKEKWEPSKKKDKPLTRQEIYDQMKASQELERLDKERQEKLKDKKSLYDPDDFRLFFKKELVDIFGAKVEPPVETPALREFTTNLSGLAGEGKIDPVIGRDKEVERVVQILSRRRKNNPILIGEPGVGKTAVAEGLALKIYNQEVATCLAEKEVAVLDVGLLLAGTKYRGEFEERLKRIMDEVKARKNLILVIDEVHTLIGAGAAEGALDAANILKPALARGELQCIGATTLDEYKQIEKDPALERRFQPVIIDEPSQDESIEILKGLRTRYENFHGVRLPDVTLKTTVEMGCSYIKDRFLPDKAIDLVDEAAARVKIANISGSTGAAKMLEKELMGVLSDKDFAIRSQDFERAGKLRDREMTLRTQITAIVKSMGGPRKEIEDKSKMPVVDNEDVCDVISAWTGIPLNKIGKDEAKKLLNMEKEMHNRVIGQDKAVKSICDAVKRSRVGIKDPDRPIASFLFCGPTGVGKTELTKTLSDYFFGSEDSMIRFDMSEFMERHTVAKLIGSPPGYVGYNEGGQLTEAVRRKPFSLVLFDEVEKAHPDIFNLLLQVLDDGRLTDSKGKTIDFTNTIIVMTSNLGSQHIDNKLQEQEKGKDIEEKSQPILGGLIEEEKKVESTGYESRIEELKLRVEGKKKEIQELQDEAGAELEKDLEADLMELNFYKKIEEKQRDDEYEEDYKKVKDLVLGEIKQFFRPEFINRIDEIIVFQKLRKEEIAQIGDIMISKLTKRLRKEGTVLHIDDEVKQYIIDEGFDPVYGARPLRRAITQIVEDAVSNRLIDTQVLTLRRVVLLEYDPIRKVRASICPLPSFVLSPYDKNINSEENLKIIQFYIRMLKNWKEEGFRPEQRLSKYYDFDPGYQETQQKEEEAVKRALGKLEDLGMEIEESIFKPEETEDEQENRILIENDENGKRGGN